jgi:hypothetical protein
MKKNAQVFAASCIPVFKTRFFTKKRKIPRLSFRRYDVMKNLLLIVAVLMTAVAAPLCTSALSGEFPAAENNPTAAEKNVSVPSFQPRKTLKAFRTQNELDDFLRKFGRSRRGMKEESKTLGSPAAAPTDGANADDSVTNVQHAGVDEGGIVKLRGDHLIVLRRGRLFTIAVGGGALRPISQLDAFGPDIDPRGTWYDEMLVSGNTIAVIGYSYQRGGTEIGLFNIDERGRLSYRATYHLRSNDYYSSRNYASRLIDGKLIFYSPQYLWINEENPTAQFPALRKWRAGADEKDFQPITTPSRVYRPAQDIKADYYLALHTVTVCDLKAAEFSCRATAVIGPAGRVFYVSPEAVYVWTTDWWYEKNEAWERSTLYQMPLDGSAPSALGVAGSPIDQFSFLESSDGFLNVLVRAQGAGDGMWRAEVTAGDVALLRVPRRSFSDGRDNAPASYYTPLPRVEGYTLQNRFVGDYLLYGTANGRGYLKNKMRPGLFAVRWATGEAHELAVPHTVDRIEALGKDAVVIGTKDRNLYFSPVGLSGSPRVYSSYVRKNAAQGELRSHGFFYKPEADGQGILGLPIREGGSSGYESLFENSASILFLRNDALNLSEIGALASNNEGQKDDGCRASCVDWYGNARPLFVRGRVFALLGYELVEGAIDGGAIREKRRVSFSPKSSAAE